MLAWLILTALASVSLAQQEGFCECGFFVDIIETGLLPPFQRTIGPVYDLPLTSEQTAPCTSNAEAACDIFCEDQYMNFRNMGYDYNTEIEYQVAPGEFENRTIGEISCEKSVQLHPDPNQYAGTLNGGSATQLQIRLNPCSNWIDRRVYGDMPLCCDDSAEHFECP